MSKINIILAKASWCPHCVKFTPIFEEAENISKKKFKDIELEYESFDLADNDIKNKSIITKKRS